MNTKRSTDNRAEKIEGTITLPDGSTSQFQISADYGWQQWGAVTERLYRSQSVVTALVNGLTEGEALANEEDYDADDTDDDDTDDETPNGE